MLRNKDLKRIKNERPKSLFIVHCPQFFSICAVLKYLSFQTVDLNKLSRVWMLQSIYILYRAPFIDHFLHTSIQCSHPIIQSSIYWSCNSFLIPFQLQSLHTDRAPSIHIVLQIKQIVLPTMFSTYFYIQCSAPSIQSFIYPSCFPNNPYIAPNHLLLIPSHTPRLSDISDISIYF